MRTILFPSALLLGLALVSSCGSSADSSGGSSFTADCQKVCDTTAPLKCPKDEGTMCVAKCQQTAAALPKCQAQIEALVKCEATHPAADWECDSDGEANLKNGCDNEGLAAIGCALGGGA
jgi:hypothetical protein